MNKHQSNDDYLDELSTEAVRQDKARLRSLVLSFASTLQSFPSLRQEIEHIFKSTDNLDYKELYKRIEPVLQQANDWLLDFSSLPAEFPDKYKLNKLVDDILNVITLANANRLIQRFYSLQQQIIEEQEKRARKEAEQQRVADEAKNREQEAQRKLEDEAKRLDELGNQRKAEEIMQQQEQEADPVYQFALGKEYYFSNNSKDFEKSLSYFESAAFQGHAEAQVYLSKIYAKEDYYAEENNITQDINKALRWMEKAAEQDCCEASEYLSDWYNTNFKKTVLPPSQVKSTYWAEKAASQGSLEYKRRIAYMYATGEGVLQDSDKAEYWFEQAALAGGYSERLDLARHYADGKLIPHDAAKAEYWLDKAGCSLEISDDRSKEFPLYQIGERYADGDGIPRNEQKAIYWLEKGSALDDHGYRQHRLGWRYMKGEGIPKNAARAIFWLEQGAKIEQAGGSHYMLSLCTLGCLYADGYYFKQNTKKALAYLTLAAQNGGDEEKLELGRRYASGEGIPTDDEKAMYWLQKATENHSHESFYAGEIIKALKNRMEAGYVDNGDNTVTDTKTGLMWKKYCEGQILKRYIDTDDYTGIMFLYGDRYKDHCWDILLLGYDDYKLWDGVIGFYTWQEAVAIPEQVNKNEGFAGYTDWRLPTIEEL